VPKFHGAPVARGEGIETLPPRLCCFALLDHSIRPRFVIDLDLCDRFQAGRGRDLAASAVAPQVAHDGRQPATGPQLADALGAVVAQRPIGTDEGFLGQVLGIGRSLGGTQRDAVDEVLVVSQELGERSVTVGGKPPRAISTHADKNTQLWSSVAVCRLGTFDTCCGGRLAPALSKEVVMKVLRSTIGVALALALALAIPTTATDEDVPTPLLEAVAYMAPSAEDWNRRFEFTDWSELKRLHDGKGITSDSPLKERQRLLLDIARSEAVLDPLGLNRLGSWKEAWGWDNTDLAWQAHIGQDDAVLRFGDHWDDAPFRAALLSRGYLASEIASGTRYAPGGDGLKFPPKLALEGVLWDIDTSGAEFRWTQVVIDLSHDGRTVIARWGGGVGTLQDGSEADPEDIAATPYGRAAMALDRPVAANIIDRAWSCAPDGSANLLHEVDDEQEALLRSVAPLHPYEAMGTGYSRGDADSSPVGRIVFVYTDAQQAIDDLPGRRLIIEEGEALAPAFFTLADARAVGRGLILDVAPLYGVPDNLHLGWRGGATYAMCGPLPD